MESAELKVNVELKAIPGHRVPQENKGQEDFPEWTAQQARREKQALREKKAIQDPKANAVPREKKANKAKLEKSVLRAFKAKLAQ